MNNAFSIRLLALLAAVASPAALAESSPAAKADYQVIPFTLDQAASRIEVLDIDGDGRPDLLTAYENNFHLYLQRDSEETFDFSKADASLEVKGAAIGWALDSGG